MYYELYIDVLFLVNFMMDALLLLLVKRFWKCTATHGRILFGAFLGSVSTCVVIALPIPYAFVKIILFHFFINVLMIYAAFQIKEWRTFIRMVITLYAGGFLMGGVFTYFHQYARAGGLFFFLAVLSYYTVRGIFWFISRGQQIAAYRCTVTVFDETGTFEVRAIIDTGNTLHDDLSGKPVCIIEGEVLRARGISPAERGIRYIGFHTVGKKEGVMPVIRLSKICVHREQDYLIENPVIGISEEKISSEGEYEMILNPDIF